MFLILRGNRPIAKLDHVEGHWELDYLPLSVAINPVLPVGQKHVFKTVPRFLRSLLPTKGREILTAKSRHLDPADLASLAKQCLATENVGDLRLVTNMAMISDPEVRQSGGLTVEASAPCSLFADSTDILRHPDFSDRVNETLKKLASASGIGGAWPKAFLYTPEGGHILKKYPQVGETTGEEMAAMESASLRAMASMGCSSVKAAAIGDMLMVKRFDKHFEEAAGVCHVADLDPEVEDNYAGSHESVAKLLLKHSGQKAVQVFARQVMFSWALGDSDHHRENYAMIRREPISAWEMAPLYDSLPSKFLTGDKEELALTLNAKKSKISLKDWAPLAKLAGMEMAEVSKFLNASVKAIQEHVLPVAGKIAPALKEHLAIVALVAQDKPFPEAQRAVFKGEVSLSQVLAQNTEGTPIVPPMKDLPPHSPSSGLAQGH